MAGHDGSVPWRHGGRGAAGNNDEESEDANGEFHHW